MQVPQSSCTGRHATAEIAQKSSEDHANVNIPPPLIHGAAVLSAVGLNEFSPLMLPGLGWLWWLWWLGQVFFLFSLILAVLGFREFLRARNPVPPNRPVQGLMVTGPFRITRNPLYLALALIHLGVAAVSGNAWILLTLPLVLLVVRYYVIAREEAYLVRRFGQDYLDYMHRVRRWL